MTDEDIMRFRATFEAIARFLEEEQEASLRHEDSVKSSVECPLAVKRVWQDAEVHHSGS